MGGEQAANVLATVAKDQRAREGKQVNAVSLSPGLTFTRTRGAREQHTQNPSKFVARIPTFRAWLYLEDTDLEIVLATYTYTFSISLFRAISLEVPSCGNLQTFQNLQENT